MAKTDKEDKIQKEIKTAVSEMLEKLKIDGKASVVEEVGDTKSQTRSFKVNIETQETGLLIGRHGETLNSLQLILGVIFYKKLGKWLHIVLDVGDYRKMREDSIREMVERIVTEVEAKGSPVTLPYLTPLERRIVHLMLTDNPKVMSESEGAGKDRKIAIKLRESA